MKAYPRLIISALRGGSGKTLISLGIIAALKRRGINVSPFKKGPDYIDAGWLELAAQKTCHHLDTFLIPAEQILKTFARNFVDDSIAVIEGNRGLYDGIDMQGSTSTAELAKLIDAPVILSIDCTKTTRTMAAAVLGCIHFDPRVKIKGVILNRIAGARHEANIRRNIETHCGIPVIGAIPKLKKQIFPERHMGLVPTPEHNWAVDSIHDAAEIIEDHIDIDAVIDITRNTTALDIHDYSMEPLFKTALENCHETNPCIKPKIGILRDSAFQFYYPENIEALSIAGAQTLFLSPFTDGSLPEIDGLYIGGGFPETHARELAENEHFRKQLKLLADQGLPIYAECGGLMFLGESLLIDHQTYPMAGVLPIVFGFSKRPQGHGYTVARVEGLNPFFSPGTELRGHEFHYSKVLEWQSSQYDFVFRMKRGVGIADGKDGASYKNVIGTYTHIHALGQPSWAGAMVKNALTFHNRSR